MDGWFLEQTEPAVMAGDRPMSMTHTLPPAQRRIRFRRWREAQSALYRETLRTNQAVSRGIGPMWSNPKPNPGAGPCRLPLVGPEPWQKNASGGPRSPHRPR